MDHIAIAHRNSGPGWAIMSTDGRLWAAESVSGDRPLAAMLDEALELLASHPGADFTFSTRAVHEVMAAPYEAQTDLIDIERNLGRSAVSVLAPRESGRWAIFHRSPRSWFTQVDICGPDDVFEFLRQWPGELETIERGISGPVEVWLRRNWKSEHLHQPITSRFGGNVTPLRRHQTARA